MEKKGLLSGILIVFCIFLISFISAAENDTEQSKVNLAYDCLENKVEGKCSSLSFEERVFSLLAIGECKNELLADSSSDECWPSSSCEIKKTAQAILALDNAGTSTSKAQDWLLLQNKTPSDVAWYLQIDSPSATTCTINDGESENTISIREDKKINSGAGCLSLAQDGYWLEIAPSCYHKEFEISCDERFVTNLLFSKGGSSKFYVSSETSEASAEGRTTEKINSFCFGDSSSCDYESSLWAALVLADLGYETNSFLPYLITMAESNEEFLPESFLYILTDDNDYRTELLDKQKSEFWEESGDKFYDTAVALYAFQNEAVSQKSDSMEWLLQTQDKNGCWKGNTRNTAFILYSVWSKTSGRGDGDGGSEGDDDDCKIDGSGYCMSRPKCEEAGGDEFVSFSSSCFGANSVCCSREEILDTCEELGGEECSGDQECSTSTDEALDTSECCLGYCREPSEESDCEYYGGSCKSSCLDDEKDNGDECDSSGDVCCVDDDGSGSGSGSGEGSKWWVWVLLILIVLVLIGIVFRDKLRPFWFRMTSRSRKSPPKRGPPRFGSRPGMMAPRRTSLRRIMPPTQRRASAARSGPRPKASRELDDVLKKLKDMGK